MAKRKSISFQTYEGMSIQEATQIAKDKLIQKFGEGIENKDGSFNKKVRVIFETKTPPKTDRSRFVVKQNPKMVLTEEESI